MYHSDDDFVDPYVLTEREVATIAAACQTLPGDWYLDTAVDHRRPGAPRMWIHPAARNQATGLSFGISKEDGVFYAAVQPRANRDDLPTEGSRCGTLDAALTMCRETLTALLQRMWTHAMEMGIHRACEAASARVSSGAGQPRPAPGAVG